MLNARLTSAFSEAKYVYDGNGAKKLMHDHDPPQPQSPAGSGFEWRAGGGIAVHHARRSMVCGF